MGNPFDPMNILLVVFAVVAFIRLRTTLGKRTGNEEPLPGKKLSANQQNGKQEPLAHEDHIKPTTSDTYSSPYPYQCRLRWSGSTDFRLPKPNSYQ